MLDEDQVREYLSKLDTLKSMGPNVLHSQVLRKLADAIPRTLWIIFEQSWPVGQAPDDWRKASVTPVFKKGEKEDQGNHRLVSLTSVPGNVLEKLMLETVFRHMEDKKRTGTS